jgi:hypothetical protein
VAQPPQVEILGLRLGMRHLPSRGHPPRTVMTVFSLGNGATSLPSGPSSGSAAKVWDADVMKLLESVPNGVGVVWASLLKKPLEVVCR